MGRTDRPTLACVGAAVAVAVLAIGGAPAWAQAAVATLIAAGLALSLRSRRAFDRGPVLVLLLLGLVAWCAVQWLPLPAELAADLSPTLAGLRQDGAAVLGQPLTARLSIDPAGTLRAITFFLTLAGVALLSLRLAISERGRYWLLVCVAGTGAAAALLVGVHELFELDRLYGVYDPRQRPVVLGPLLNTNHLGGLMAVSALVAVGLLFYPKQRSLVRSVWALAALACIATTLATLSRGAVIGLGAGLLITLAILIAQRFQPGDRDGPRRRSTLLVSTLPLGVMIVCGLLSAVWLGAGSAMHQLETTSLDELDVATSKYAAWRSAATLVDDSPWVGVGRGGFESAFTRVHAASGYATFSHPENEYVQAVVEWGIPAALAAGLAALWLLTRALRRWRDGPLAAGAIGAISVVLFQSNFDFGMEVLGLAVPVIVLVATLTYVPLGEIPGRRAGRARAARLALIVGLVASAGVLVAGVAPTVGEDHRALTRTPSRAQLTAMITRHPLDYLAYGQLADQRARAGEPGTIDVLNHALRLHPTHPGLHRLAARLLHRARFAGQARAEYGLALRYSADPRPLVQELIAAYPAAQVADILPLELNLQRTAQLLDGLDRPEVTRRWLQRAVASHRNPRAAEVLYRLALRDRDMPALEVAARDLCRQVPGPRCQLQLAQALAQQGKHPEVITALADVEQWTGRVDDKATAWLLLCDAHAALAQRDRARACLRALEVSGLLASNQAIEQRLQALAPDDAPAPP